LSRFRCPDGDDHPDAAGKHLSDALTLWDNGRFDGAAYLSGYVVECSLKTLIILQTRRAAIRGHKLNELSERALDLARLPNSRTARYNRVISGDLSIRDPVNGWKETLRYHASGSISPDEANVWVNEAVAVYQSTVAHMKLDGVL
jgi:hypothetical protein